MDTTCSSISGRFKFLLFLFFSCNYTAREGHSLGHYFLLLSVVSHAAASNNTFRTGRLSVYQDRGTAHPLLLRGFLDFSQTAKQCCQEKGIFLTFTLLEYGQIQTPQAAPTRTWSTANSFSFMGGQMMCLQGFLQWRTWEGIGTTIKFPI